MFEPSIGVSSPLDAFGLAQQQKIEKQESQTERAASSDLGSVLHSRRVVWKPA
jgi:hypothetical protein